MQVILEEEAQLWWAAKEMQRGKKLQDYIGKNEKTKIVVKIQKVGALAFCPECPLSASVIFVF